MNKPEEELKRLLLSAELDLLDRLRDRCAHLETRVGDDPAMKDSVRGVIVEALRDAGVRDHDRMARVLAPLVLASMREEIRNSSDMMVDALYPITGRLVAAAVGNAFRELMETLDEKLNSGLSTERWRVWLQAKATGRSEAELLLQRDPPFEIEDLLVVHAPTGLLVARAQDQEQDQVDGAVDSDLLGGMLTAILAFSRDALKGDGAANGSDELRTVSFGESELFLRASPGVILAVKARGTAPAGFQSAFEELFCAFLEHWGETLRGFDGVLDDDTRRGLIDDLRDRFRALVLARKQRFREPSRKGLVALAVVLLLLLTWVGAYSYEGWRVAGIEAEARRIVAAQPALTGYPITADFDDEAGVIVVEGLFPDASARAALETALGAALPDLRAELHAGVLPRDELHQLQRASAAAGATLNDVTRRLDQLEAAAARLEASFAGAVAAIEGQSTSYDERTGNLEGVAAGLEGQVDALSRSLAGRLERLERRAADIEGMAGGLEVSFNALNDTLGTRLTKLDQRTGQLEGTSESLKGSLGDVSDKLGSTLAQQSGDLQGLAQRLETSVGAVSNSLAARLARLDERLAAIESVQPTPLDKLELWSKRNAILFDGDIAPRDASATAAKLGDLVGLLEGIPPEVRLRIVGYSDETGGRRANQRISLQRALFVAEQLRGLDVPAERMLTVGRATERPVSMESGRGSGNRRVEFELIYPDGYRPHDGNQ